MNPPLISVITPTLNVAASLEATLLSVARQTYRPLEHWIIDGGSTDGTLEVVARLQERFPHIRLLVCRDRGPYEAMNRGIDRARGDWLYFLGASDRFYDDAVLSDLAEAGWLAGGRPVYGNVLIVGDCAWAKDGAIYDGPFDLDRLLRQNLCHQAILYPAPLVLEVGYFKRRYAVMADWDYNLRCAAREEFVYVDRIIANFSGGGLSSSGAPDPFVEDLPRLARRYFDRGDGALRRRPAPDAGPGTLARRFRSAHGSVGAGDDLLHALSGRPITEDIRTLFVVGAHLFQEAKLVFRLFPRLAKVVLVEPQPGIAARLRAAVAGDPRIEVLGYAIADANGRAAFHVTDNDGESSSLLPMGTHRDVFPWVNVVDRIEVPTLSLEEAIRRHGLPCPDMLFLDVQGAEYAILATLGEELRLQIRLIYTECSTEEVYRGARPLSAIEALLRPDFLFLGYVPLLPGTPMHGNALFVHRHCESDLEATPDDPPAAERRVQPGPAGVPPARNAPCPCGSGRRYKDCHGRLT